MNGFPGRLDLHFQGDGQWVRQIFMRTIAKNNFRVGAAMFLFAAACSGGAALIYSMTSKPGLAAAYCSLTGLSVVVSALLFKKSRETYKGTARL
jgi:hypothetical protein